MLPIDWFLCTTRAPYSTYVCIIVQLGHTCMLFYSAHEQKTYGHAMHCAVGVAMIANKNTLTCDACMPCQSILSILKPVFQQICCTYNSLWCLDLQSWQFLSTTKTTKPIALPLAHNTQGNYCYYCTSYSPSPPPPPKKKNRTFNLIERTKKK